VLAVAVSPDGKLVASGSADGSIRVWELATGKEKFVITGHRDKITALTFTSDNKWLVSAGEEKTLKVWGAADGKESSQFADVVPDNEIPVLTAVPGGTAVIGWGAFGTGETYTAAT